MKPFIICIRRQQGAVSILAGLTIIVLFGFLALVVDLGNLYVNKSELQNAADAAALAGARELVGTSTGVNKAVQAAKDTAALNKSVFGTQSIIITNANIQFSSTSVGPWEDVAAVTSPGGAAGKYFIKVDTSGIAQSIFTPWFARVFDALGTASATTQTFGMAVAGRAQCEGVPLFICARSGSPPDFGFVRGKAYRFTEQSGSGNIGPGNVGYIDPVPPGAPSLNNGVNAMRDVMCRGKTYCMTAGTTYKSLTQGGFGPMAKAMNTRFGQYGSPSPLDDSMQCRPDTNVKEYPYDGVVGSGAPKDWMTTAPTAQNEDDGGAPGVHWSAVRPSTTPAAPLTLSAGYPATKTPYEQTSGIYWTPAPNPSDRPNALAGRRILTVAMADFSQCGTINGAGKNVNVVGFARFFMPVKAIETGSSKGFYGEFIEAVDATPFDATDIKLYQ